MKGLELSKKYYLEYGAPMIKEKFPDLEALIAIGLVGSGSECLGYDDDISTDHDFEPGFCMFIPDEDIIDSKTEFLLERAYSKLPREFMGYSRSSTAPVGERRHGVIRLSDFFTRKVGSPDGKLSTFEWFSVPEHSLAEAVDGEVFRDDLGLFTSIRERLSNMPNDVRLKKLAGHLLLMAQAGQYNYSRCVSRGETGAAQLAIIEFVKSTMQVIFLLNNKYMPYYKWSFRAMGDLDKFSELTYSLEYLISSENTRENTVLKTDMVEDIAGMIIAELKAQNLTEAICGDLEKHAYSVNDKIIDNDIRNKNIFYAI